MTDDYEGISQPNANKKRSVLLYIYCTPDCSAIGNKHSGCWFVDDVV